MAEHECVQLVPIFSELGSEQLDTIESIVQIVCGSLREGGT